MRASSADDTCPRCGKVFHCGIGDKLPCACAGISLQPEVQAALRLQFDGCLCVSVIEHVPGDGDAEAMEQMWRVLRPGGTLRLTTNVAAAPREVATLRPIYGEASAEAEADGSVFFERHYTAADLRERLLGLPWEVLQERYVRQRDPRIHERFHRAAPASYTLGAALRFVCPSNFAAIGSPEDLADGEMGVAFLELRRPLSS